MKTRSTLKTALLTTVAAASVAGFTAIAAAQTTQSPAAGGATKPGAAQSGPVEQKGAPGGAMKYQQNGATQGEKSSGTSGQSAQEERNERGAQTENAQTKGAQEERNERGAQTESGKAGVNATQQNAQGSVRGGATGHGASVQLSQDQRSRIGGIIGKSSSARLTSKPDFDITVGATVPRSVHVVTVPEDVVEVVPQYRGYDYVVVSDQILIIDPDTMEIVAVIET